MPPPALSAGEGTRERVAEAVQRLSRTLPPESSERMGAVLGAVPFHEARTRWRVELYPSEAQLRQALARGEIDEDDLRAALEATLGADQALVPGLSRFALHGAILRHGIARIGADALDFRAEETDAVTRLRDDLSAEQRRMLVDEARSRLEAALSSDGGAVACARLLTSAHLPDEVPASLARELDLVCERKALRRALAHAPERLAAKAMFEACLARAENAHHSLRPRPAQVELHRDVLAEWFDERADELVRPRLTRLCSAFLARDDALRTGFYAGVRARHTEARPRLFAFEKNLHALFRAQSGDAFGAVCDALRALGVREADWTDYLDKLAFTLPSVAGAFADLDVSKPGSMLDFLAVLLTYEHAALLTQSAHSGTDLALLLDTLPPRPLAGEHPRALAYRMFQAVQLTGLHLGAILSWTREQASAFALAVQSFDAVLCRRVLFEAQGHHRRKAILAGSSTEPRASVLRAPPGEHPSRWLARTLPEALRATLDDIGTHGRALRDARAVVIVECPLDELRASLAEHPALEVCARGGWLHVVGIDPRDGSTYALAHDGRGAPRSALESTRRAPRRRLTSVLVRLWSLTRPLIAFASALERVETGWLALLSDKRTRTSLRPSMRTLRPSQRAERP